MTRFFSRIASGMILGLAALSLAPAQAAEPYTTLNPAQPQDVPAGKVEVMEFFAYSCPHCNAIEPLVEKWRKTAPEQVVFKWVPVAFNAGMVAQQKMLYTLEALDRMDLHDAFFKAIHEEHKDLYDADDITQWAVAHGIDQKTFTDAFESFGVQTKTKRANELAKEYRIEGTPSFAIAGQYVTSPSQTGSYQGAVDEMDKLVKQVLAAQ